MVIRSLWGRRSDSVLESCKAGSGRCVYRLVLIYRPPTRLPNTRLRSGRLCGRKPGDCLRKNGQRGRGAFAASFCFWLCSWIASLAGFNDLASSLQPWSSQHNRRTFSCPAASDTTGSRTRHTGIRRHFRRSRRSRQSGCGIQDSAIAMQKSERCGGHWTNRIALIRGSQTLEHEGAKHGK